MLYPEWLLLLQSVKYLQPMQNQQWELKLEIATQRIKYWGMQPNPQSTIMAIEKDMFIFPKSLPSHQNTNANVVSKTVDTFQEIR